MYWFHFNLCLIVVALLTPYIVSAEDSGQTNFNADAEVLPLEQTLDHNDVSMVEPAQPARRLLRQSFMPNFNGNMVGNTGFQFPQGLVQAPPHIGQPLDAQVSSASNNVVLVLDNDKNKFDEPAQPAEESLKRLTRNPDAIDDLLGQFQQLSGGVTQQFLQQVSQTAPDISKSFGQALNEVLTQTNLLAQLAPPNLNFTQMRDNLGQSNLPGSIDLGQLSQNFFVGATQNLFNPIRSRDVSEGATGAEVSSQSGTVGAAAAGETTQGADAFQSPKTPFVGQSLFPQFSQLPQLNPLGMFAHFSPLRPLMPSGSEISEVRVLPEQYSPYKVSPKQVDVQTMAEMRLKAVLKEALNKKTIPILWFHLPTTHKLQKTKEDVEMETKLQMFEQQVIGELKQLQELARMANEVKRAELQSGAQPTTSLTTKLNLFEIPVYDITLGDIEKTLKDEHVMMLMQTLVQKQNKEFQRHQQATTKYLTDITGTPIKRQVKTSEDAFKTMEKDDMMKMMSYAYRMASTNGHEMPWLKKKNMTSVYEQETTKGSRSGEQQQQQLKDASTQMDDERKWLEDKQRQMTFEAEKQKFANKQEKMEQNPMRHWGDPAVNQQQLPVQRQMMPPQMQHQMAVQRQMMPPQMQQPMPVERQMMRSQMHQPMSVERQMMTPQMQQQMAAERQMSAERQMAAERQMMPPQMQQQMTAERHMMPEQMSAERQMMSPQMQQQMAVERHMMSPHMQEQMSAERQMMAPQIQQQMAAERQMMPQQMQQHMPVQNQMFDFDMRMTQQDTARQMMQQQDTARQMMPPQMAAERQMMPPQMQQPMPVQNQMFDFEMQMQQQDTPRQMMQQQDAPRQMMQQQGAPMQIMQQQDTPMQMMQQQPMMTNTNFDMEEPMHTQRQQQQPMMEMQREEQFQRHSVDTSKPETKSSTDQKPEPRKLAETEIPGKTTGFKAEKMHMTKPIANMENTDQLPEQKQQIDTETPENQATSDMRMDNTPTVAEAKLQMPENEGKARFKGIDNWFGKHGFSNHHRHHHLGGDKLRPPAAVYNYYYNNGGSRYPPIYGPPHAAPQIYGHAGGYANPHHYYNHHAPPPTYYHHHPASSHYAHGSNSYAHGSSYGGYRSATGDEEIAIMLQQHQQEEQPKPKMIMPMPHNDESAITTSTTTTQNDKNNAAHLIKNHSKRLAKKQAERYKNAAAYVIVLRNNPSSKSGRSRRKRSTEFATLEPIDENSLTALRKVYKNSLKEITLNPNESPAEALMRYNAESIREALEKANKQPLEITADQEDVQIKENKSEKEVEQQDTLQQQISKQLPQGYTLSDNNQFVPVAAGPETPASNGPYIILPAGMQQAQAIPVSFSQQSAVMYDPAQEGVHNNMISKYNTPIVYSSSNNKFLTQNPFLSINNPVETMPFIDEYSVLNQPYQLADGAEKANKFIVYQRSDAQPHLTYNDFITPSNAINKNLQYLPTSGHHVKDYDKTKIWHYDNFVRELPSTKTDYSAGYMANKNNHLDAYSHIRQSPLELTNSYRSERSQESSSLGNIIDIIKEELVQCCNTCKDNILKRLDETWKYQYLENNLKPYNSFTDKSHTLTYRKPSNDKDIAYKQWLAQMSEKGYDKGQLTKEHQKVYLKDGKLNLHVADEQGFGQPVEQIYFKNDQSYKRDTTISEGEVEADKETKVVTAPIEYVRKIENLKVEDEDAQEEEEEEEEEEEKEDETEAKTQKPSNNEDKNKNTTTIIKKETEIRSEKEKTNTIDKKDTDQKDQAQNSNTNKTIHAAESTTHSVYALRGQFRSYKAHPMPFSLKQGKQFRNFKNINKLGTANSIRKWNDGENDENKNNKLEEILDILLDLSQQNKETDKRTDMEENFSATKSSIGTPYQTINAIKASAENANTKTSNAANIMEKPRKLLRRRLKSRKLA